MEQQRYGSWPERRNEWGSSRTTLRRRIASGQLPVHPQRARDLVDARELTMAEIAAAVGVSISTLATRDKVTE